MNVISLCSGIGGIELGFEQAGMTIIGQVEIDEFCRQILTKHWPKVPQHDDIRTCVNWWRTEPRPPIHLIVAGFPCQPAALCGQRRGETDERWLWPHINEVITQLEPEWFVFENVPGLRTMGLGTVLTDLHGLGYTCRVGEISACAMGAPHPRTRLFGVAHSPSRRLPTRRSTQPRPALLEPVRRGPQHRRIWTRESRPHGVAYGIPHGMDRRRTIGNAVSPQVAEHIGRLILTTNAEVAA